MNADEIVKELRESCTGNEFAPPMVTNRELTEAADLIESLQAQLNGAVPVVRGECNHCKEDSCELCFNAGHYVICEDGMNETCEYFQKMNYCPNCGAKMEVEP